MDSRQPEVTRRLKEREFTMSVSLYYTATRPQSITSQEQTACGEIAARYDAQWHVNIDDTELPWSEDVHYLFPIEEADG